MNYGELAFGAYIIGENINTKELLEELRSDTQYDILQKVGEVYHKELKETTDFLKSIDKDELNIEECSYLKHKLDRNGVHLFSRSPNIESYKRYETLDEVIDLYKTKIILNHELSGATSAVYPSEIECLENATNSIKESMISFIEKIIKETK